MSEMPRGDRAFWETSRSISHAEAREVAVKFIDKFFGNTSDEYPKASIPANPDRDDDLVLMSYICQQERGDATAAAKERDKFTIDGRGPMPTFEIAINAHENLRTRAALAAMTGILASGVWVDWSERSVADAALRHADALIAALKEK